ncbi:sporulation protein [Thermoflavimicrobium dichotomicum]|nr:sporulation protein [Thermoflavimicrobium dichotomicum]
MKKWLASLGFGSAKVDTRLEDRPFFPGEQVKGEIVIRGGDADQQIEDIYLELIAEYLKDGKNVRHICAKYYIARKILISPHEEKTLPLSIKLPMELPMSTGRFPIYLRTGLDIKMALDPQDQDRIDVIPKPLVQKILKDIEDAGFVLYSIVNRYVSGRQPYPFVQVFEFRPTGRYHGVLDQLHVFFDYTEEEMAVHFEIYRSGDIISYSFCWKHQKPSETLRINDQPCQGDPLLKIQELLHRKNG